jgi:hypothetical protein
VASSPPIANLALEHDARALCAAPIRRLLPRGVAAVRVGTGPINAQVFVASPMLGLPDLLISARILVEKARGGELMDVVTTEELAATRRRAAASPFSSRPPSRRR